MALVTADSLVHKAPRAGFLALAWRERPRIVNNPVILRELIDRLRKKSSFVYLALFLAVAVIILALFWPEYVRRYATPSLYAYSNGTPREFFLFLNMFLGIFLFLLAPLLSATSVNLEYERETWELLATTHLNPASILLAKWISSIFFIWILSLSLIPIYGICFTMGGVSPEEVGFIFLIYTEVTAITAAIGIYCSVVWKHTVKSVSFTYLGSFAFLVLLPVCGKYLGEYGLLIAASPLVSALVYFSGPSTIISTWRNSPAWLANHIYLTHSLIILGFISLLFIITLWRLFTQQEYSDAEQFKGYFRSLAHKLWRTPSAPRIVKEINLMPSGRNPVTFKELLALRGRYRLRMLFTMACWLGASFCFYLPWSVSSRPPHFQIVEWADTMPFAVILLTPLFIIPYAANCFRHEKDHGTWDLLVTT
ncbi:MAG: ABC transporter permease, partial [bacterium]